MYYLLKYYFVNTYYQKLIISQDIGKGGFCFFVKGTEKCKTYRTHKRNKVASCKGTN